MRKFKSWSILFVLALLVSLFFGCGGSGGGYSSDDSSGWDTDPTPERNTTQTTPHVPIDEIPTEPVDITPNNPTDNTPTEPTNPTTPTTPDTPVEPTPTAPTTPTTYTDTYDIASVMNGSWTGVSGSGIAIDANGEYSLFMTSLEATMVGTQITGDSGISYITFRQYWDSPQDTNYTYLMFGDNTELNLQHIGVNTWQCVGDGTSIIFRFTSATTAMVTQEGTTDIEGHNYRYSINYTIRKQSGSNEVINPTPTTPTTPDTGNDTYTDTYDIASVLDGTWYGISGSGFTTNTERVIALLMSHISISLTHPQMIGDVGTTYITQNQYWDYTDGEHTYQAPLNEDNVQNNITHIGADTWRFTALDSTITTITLTSEVTAEVTQNGTVNIDGYLWQYQINYVLHKEGSYDTSALHGTWKATTPYNAGIGTATSQATGSNYDTLELKVSSANLSCREARESNLDITHSVRFGVYRNSIYVNSVNPSRPRESVSVQQLDNDTFRYRLSGFDTNTGSPSSASSVTVNIKLTSDATAEVIETGHFRLDGRFYTYNVFYRLTKQ